MDKRNEKFTDQHKSKISNALTGRNLSHQHKQNLIKAARQRWNRYRNIDKLLKQFGIEIVDQLIDQLILKLKYEETETKQRELK